MSYKLHAKYPGSPALDHYRAMFRDSWQYCERNPSSWSAFFDATVQPERKIHQQLAVWVNREENQALFLSARYYSSVMCGVEPETDEQHIVLVQGNARQGEELIGAWSLQCQGAGNAL